MKRAASVDFLTFPDATFAQEAYNRVINALATDGQDRYEEALDLLKVGQKMCLFPQKQLTERVKEEERIY